MSVGTALKPQDAARVGEMMLSENKRLTEDNVSLTEKVGKLEARLTEVEGLNKQLKEFEVLLDEEPRSMAIYLTDKKVMRALMARAIKLYPSKAGANPDNIEDEKLRRRARLNLVTIVHACLKYGLGPAWNKVNAAYIKPIRL